MNMRAALTWNSYLWPGYEEEESSHHHVLLIVLMTIAKTREDLPAWSMVKHCYLKRFGFVLTPFQASSKNTAALSRPYSAASFP